MPGFCGWFATPDGAMQDGADSAERTLARMGERIAWSDRLDLQIVQRGGAALCLVSRLPGAVHRGEDGSLAAIDGHPRWSDERLAGLARASGFAASLALAFREMGEDCLNHLEGSFALALHDAPSGQGLLAIDRFGIASLGYCAIPGGLAFATNLDALRAHPDVPATVGPQGIYRYVFNANSPAPLTIYDEHRKLLPAYRVLWSDGAADVGPYWRVPYGAREGRKLESLREELFERLREAVGRSLESANGGRTGAFLSGGLDSSVVAGLAAERLNGALSAFTIGFQDEVYDEAHYARMAAGRFGLDHHEYRLTPEDVVAALPLMAEAFDEPFGNSSVLPAYICAKMAADNGCDMILAGDGGDEIFAGNKRYVDQKVLALPDSLPGFLRGPLDASVSAVPGGAAISPLGKVQRYLERARQPMPERMLGSHRFTPEGLRAIFTDDALAEIDAEEPLALWRQHYEDADSDEPLYRMMHLDLRITLADSDLRKVGRACDLAGIPVAFPLLDEALVAFAASVPPDVLIKRFRLRDFFREATRGYLPDEIIAKEKHGFGMPFTEWTRDHAPLRDIAADSLDSLKSRRFFRPEFIEDVRSGADGAMLWDLMSLELWLAAREG